MNMLYLFNDKPIFLKEKGWSFGLGLFFLLTCQCEQ